MIGIFRDNLMQPCCQVVPPCFFFSLEQTSFPVSLLNFEYLYNIESWDQSDSLPFSHWIFVTRVTDKKIKDVKD